MKEGCDFLSEDEHEAFEHMEQGSDHEVVEIILNDSRLTCRQLGHLNERLELGEVEE
jgi:hypothetical protein